MLNAFLSLIDYLVALVRKQQQDKSRFFNEIIEPLFSEFQSVVENYFSLFRTAKQLLSDSSEDKLGDAFQTIYDNRENMLVARIKVRELADAIKGEITDDNAIRLMDKMVGFFYSHQVDVDLVEEGIPPSSMGSQLVDLWDEYIVERIASQHMNKADLLDFIEQALDNMQTSWVDISKEYGICKTTMTAPSRYTR